MILYVIISSQRGSMIYMESNGNEIIISKNNGQYPFNRVDFNDYASILNYGADILQQIEEASIVHAKMLESQGVTDSLDDELKSIMDFSEQVGRIEINKENQKEEKGLRKIGSMLSGVIKKKSKEFLDTDFISFEKYQENLESIAEMVRKESSAVLLTITQNSDFKKIMNPLVEQLKLLIEVGEADLAEYKINVLKPREDAYNANPTDTGIARSYNESKLITDVFEETLVELKKGLSKCDITLTNMELSQKPNMTLVRQYNAYLKTSQPFLYLQGSSMVETQRQRDRINKFNRIIDVTNGVYVRNAEMLVENIEDSTELEKRGSMLIDTIKEVAELTNKGIQLYESSALEVQQARKKDLEDLTAIIEQMDASRQRISNITIDGDEMSSMFDKKALPKTRRRGRK